LSAQAVLRLPLRVNEGAHRERATIARDTARTDYVSSDLRFQRKYEGKEDADARVMSHGYADMTSLLDPGSYRVDLCGVAGLPAVVRKGDKLGGASVVRLRAASRAQYQNRPLGGAAPPRACRRRMA